MNNLPRQILRQIFSQYGPALLEDPRLCQSLLRDLCGKYKSEINLLIVVQRLIIAREVKRYIDTVPHELLISQLIFAMCREFAFDQKAAHWAVYSWAQALELSVADLEIEESSEEATVSEEATISEARDTRTTESSQPETVTKKDGGEARTTRPRKRRVTKSSTELDSQKHRYSEIRVYPEPIDATIEFGIRRKRFAAWAKLANTKLKRFFGIREVTGPQALPTSKGRNTSEVQLHLKYPLHEPPEMALWFKEELEEVSSYIEAEQTTRLPLILTGYEGFGGTSIVNWATTQAANRIAYATGSSADTAVFVLHSHVDDLKGDISLNIDKGLAQIKSRTWQKFNERFAELFDQFNSYPFHQLEKMFTKDLTEVNPRLVGTKTPIEVNVPFGEHIVAETEMEFRLKPKADRIATLLNELDNRIPTERHRKRSDSGLPYRIVLVIDSVNDCRLLKAIERFRPPFKALRIIVILNKHSYDQHMRSSAMWLRSRFETIRFLPLFQCEIAHELCRYYFDVQQELLKNKKIRSLIEGLEFRCRGLPGNFGKIMKNQMEVENNLLTLNSKTVAPWKKYQKVGMFLDHNWKKILTGYFHSAMLTDREQSAPLRLFLYHVSEKIIDTCQGKSENEMIEVCMDHAAKTWCPSNDSLASSISQELVQALSKEQLLTVKPSDELW